VVEEHNRKVTHRYMIHTPAHEPRKGDPNYVDFNAYRKRTKATAKCAIGELRNDFSECSLDKPLELHHSHIEFALANEIELKWLEASYPGVSDPKKIGEWIESAENLTWLCEYHHRSFAGIHSVAYSDYEASKYIRNLIMRVEENEES